MLSQSQSQSHITTDGRSVSMFWCRARYGTCDQIFSPLFKVAVLSLWGALSDERSGVSFVSILSMESIVVSQYLHNLFTLTIYILCVRQSSAMYNIYKASVSSGSVQQIRP
jgi:hypothetical protein